MRSIDADALFDEAFKAWGTEADAGEANLFVEMINNAPTITPPPNDPLTLEELREMDGEPVFITIREGSCTEFGFWALVETWGGTDGVWLTNNLGGRTKYDSDEELDADDIRAYRRRPEEREER